MNPVDQGFALEELIHNASLKIPEILSLRENAIRSWFNDASLNGVDHWMKHKNINVLIQDKWKESSNQQEVSQFLQCADRIHSRLPAEDIVYLIWASKREPTANSLKSLQEKGALIVCSSISIEALAKNVLLQVNDCFDTDSTACLQAIPKTSIKAVSRTSTVATVASVAPVIQTFDDSDEGKKLLDDIKLCITNIHNNIIRKLENAQAMESIPDIYSLMNAYYPRTADDWCNGKFSKIDYNSYMKTVKTICWPTNKKKLQSRHLFYYTKIRKISIDFGNLVNEYEMKRKNLLSKKSVWAKNLPVLKCTPEPMGEGEFKGAIENCEDYWIQTFEGKVVNKPLTYAFYGHQCNIY